VTRSTAESASDSDESETSETDTPPKREQEGVA